MSADQGQARWQAIWQSRGIKAWALRPIAWVYGTLSSARRGLYAIGWLKTERMPVPVLVVGNVVVGGAGKTPTVLALLDHLRQQGWRPGVVSRGYGRKGNAPLEVQPNTPCALSGDEPALIKRQSGVPVFVASKRAEAARALLATHPTVNILLCDDGLQHLALGRDLAIAVFDDRGAGNGWLLPAGLLREPWPPRGKTAFTPDLVLHQRTQGAAKSAIANLPTFQAQRRLGKEAINGVGRRIALEDLALLKPTAFAGIARPEAFFTMLREEGLVPTQTIALPDHAGAESYRALRKNHAGALVCTEKDAVKLFDREADLALGDAERIWAVPLTLQAEPAFFAAVDAHLTHVLTQSTRH